MRMDAELAKGIFFPDEDHDDDVETGDFKMVKTSSISARKIFNRSDSPCPPECARSDTPSSDSSTSGIVSMGSYDDDEISSEREEETEDEYDDAESDYDEETTDNESEVVEDDEVQSVAVEEEQVGVEEKQEVEIDYDPVINYGGRNVLDLGSNLFNSSPFYTPAVLPKFRVEKYWENRSVYHRLGLYGSLDEFGYKKCDCCDFYYPYQLETNLFI